MTIMDTASVVTSHSAERDPNKLLTFWQWWLTEAILACIIHETMPPGSAGFQPAVLRGQPGRYPQVPACQPGRLEVGAPRTHGRRPRTRHE